MSIYVNPTQFSIDEDFGVYPRSEVRFDPILLSIDTHMNPCSNAIAQESDLAKLEAAGCDAVFMPTTLYHQSSNADSSMVVGVSDGEAVDYDSHCTWVTVDHLSEGLCAGSRPHFFRGVATVVAKLFNIVDPDAAFFGKKDYQQWRILTRMARDLDFAIDIVGMPITREADGLAMSSRNALLTPEYRTSAPCIYKALEDAKAGVESGVMTDAGSVSAHIARAIEEGGGVVDYVQVVHAENLQPVGQAGKQPTLIAVAARFGKVRLIDNIDF